jgi:molybdopterin synthase sulfur carrier subunit
MVKIQYFASLRETLGTQGEELALPAQVKDVAQLASYLSQGRSGEWAALEDPSRVLIAVNQTIVERSHPLEGAEEVAFFPPMTGG